VNLKSLFAGCKYPEEAWHILETWSIGQFEKLPNPIARATYVIPDSRDSVFAGAHNPFKRPNGGLIPEVFIPEDPGYSFLRG
jgi:hypothetical protein